MESSSHRGLVWEEGLVGRPVPTWAYEPSLASIEKICRERLRIAKHASCTSTFHASGAFNKLYLIDAPDFTAYPKLLMRVSLPVDPQHKTRGEVATLRWIRQNTNLPVPKVICYDDSDVNDIGFEWILKELMPGKPAYNLWRGLSMNQKLALVERVAEFQTELLNSSSRDNLRGIGTLYVSGQTPTIGRIVDRHFFWGDHINYPIERGPFQDSHDWLAVHLEITIREHTARLDDPDNDEEDREYIQSILRLARKLLALLPKIFPPIEHSAEPTFLWHDDLNLNNILLDDEGNITAVLDWEFLACQPSWFTTKTPAFLNEEPREEEPLRDVYADDDGTLDNMTGLDNEGKNELFWEHLMQWEATQLRKVYNAKLESLRPGWETERAASALRVDFLNGVDQCAQGSFNSGSVELWADAVKEGRTPDLMEVLRSSGLWMDDSGGDESDAESGASDGA